MTAAAEGSAPAARRRGDRYRLLQSEAVQGLALISPTFLYALVLLVVPILVVIAHSFWTQNYLTIDRTFTLENYRIALTEPIYRDLLLRSLYISLHGQLLHRRPRLSDRLFHLLPRRPPQEPVAVPDHHPVLDQLLLRVMSWKVILGYNGVLNSGLMGLGIIDEPSTALLYNSSAVIITLTHAWAAFAILPIFVSLEKIDRTLLEAATDLGDGPFRRFLRVTLPLSVPGVISALLIVMIPTVGDYVTPRLVGGKDGVMIANAIQAQFGKAANWPLGAALSVTTMLIVTAMAGRTVLIIRTRGEAGAMSSAAEAPGQLAAGLCVSLCRLPLSAGALPADLLVQHLGDAEIPALRLHAQMVSRTCRAPRRCSTRLEQPDRRRRRRRS